jgi:hypothetical protein
MTPITHKLKRIIYFLLLINLLPACSIVYINAADYRLADHIEVPKIGSKRIFKKDVVFPLQFSMVYEVDKKKARFVEVRTENYVSRNQTLYISYFYNTLKVKDDWYSDDETFPIVMHGNGRIVGYGWDYVDSLKQIKFLDRLKK